jgi:hypothetical protein
VKKYLLVVVLVIAFAFNSIAQCAMCGETARTSLKEGKNDAKGLNAGIFYLLMGPYALVLAGGIIWYRQKKKAQKEFAELNKHLLN